MQNYAKQKFTIKLKLLWLMKIPNKNQKNVKRKIICNCIEIYALIITSSQKPHFVSLTTFFTQVENTWLTGGVGIAGRGTEGPIFVSPTIVSLFIKIFVFIKKPPGQLLWENMRAVLDKKLRKLTQLLLL